MYEFHEFHSHVADLVTTDVVKQMHAFVQHGSISTLEHVICVAYVSFLMAKKYKADARQTARGAILHDLYLYDWHIKEGRPPLTHGFTHPTTALRNAVRHFRLTKIEQDIIQKHMWPLTFYRIPRYKASILVSLADKRCAFRETTGSYLRSPLRKAVLQYLHEMILKTPVPTE